MKDTKKSGRLYELERLLLHRSTVSQLADRLALHRSTIYRYLDELSVEGIPVMHDETSEYWWIDTSRYLSNIRLKSAESLVLYLAARRMVRQTHIAIPAVINALEKLAAVLRANSTTPR